MNIKIPNKIIEMVCLLEYEKQKKTENGYRWIARKLPKRLVYFTTIELWARTTSGKYGNTPVCELTVDDALRMYDKLIEQQQHPIPKMFRIQHTTL